MRSTQSPRTRARIPQTGRPPYSPRSPVAPAAPFYSPAIVNLIAIGFFLSLAESIAVSQLIPNATFAPSQAKISTYVYSAGVCLLALTASAGVMLHSRVLIWMGQRSYVLYLSHLLFLLVAVNLAKPIPWIWQHQAMFIPLAMLFALAAASACVFVAERILPRQLAYYMLGIKPR